MNKKTLNKRVTIADMVYLTNDREGIVRFKGKTGFGLGEWYGIELRTEHKTRHDGLIHGKRYFRCPRNKGLFVRKQIIVDVMDKKTAVQKARVFKMGGSLSSRYRKKNKTKKNKIKKKTQNKKQLNKKITKPKVEQIENNININNKNISKRSSIIQKEGDDTKYIKLSVQDINEVEANDTADETDNDNDNDDKEEEQQEEMKDFSSKESFSNPKSRKYFGKDQIFTTLDRRRSKNEDVFLMDNVGNNIAVKMPTLMEEEETEKEEEELEEKIILKDDNNNNISENNKTKSIQFRPFGSETHTPKVQLIAPSHIKQISMEFTKGNLKAKLKKVVTTKRKKRNGTIRNVYSKYAIRADYPKLDDLRNETLVSEFLSFNLYKLYRNEVGIINDYTIDKAIECGCFYLPDRIGFRLADYKTYKIFEGLCNELLSILHDEWNKKDKPHKKNIDWTLLIKDKENKGINAASKRSKSPNPIGHKHNKNRGRNRGVSGGGMYLKQLSEKRKKSKRKTSDLVSSPLVSMEESDGLIINEESETVFNNNDITIENINAIMNEDIMDDEEEQMLQQRPIQRSESQNNIEINIYNKKDKKDRKDKKHKKDKHDKDKEKEREKRRKSHIKAHRRKKKQNKSIHIRGDIRSNFYNYYGIGSSLWDNNYIISCRLTLSRNIRGFRFSNVITRNERRNIETILSSILNQCNEGTLKGRYRAYHKIDSSKIPLLIETDKLFPKPDAPPLIMAGYARDWPESRGIFINNNKNLYMWCNYLEHLHFISVQNDGNILQAFKRLFDSEQKLETLIKQRQQIFLDNLREKQKNILEKTDNNKNRITKQEYKIKKMSFDGLKTGFVCDDELGYITSNPQYFGTSMRVYVTVKLPNLIKHDKFNDILEIRNLTAYQHDVDSAQKMFNTYANQLPTNKEVRQRIRSKTAEQEKLLNVNDEQKVNDNNNNNNNNEQKENDFMSNLNLNLPEIITNKQYNEYNQPKVSLKTLKTLKISQEEKKENDENETNVLIHDDEDLGDVVNPIHYKEEITIYQTTSLGISEIDQVRNMIEAINYLIEMEKLLSAGNKLDERIKSEKIKKNEKKFKKLI